MNRRGFVGLLALLGGCTTRLPLSEGSHGQDDGRGQPAVAATDATQANAATPTPPTQPTEEPTTDPAAAPGDDSSDEPEVQAPAEDAETVEAVEAPEEREPTEFERRGLQRLESADLKLGRVVHAFTAGYGSELTDVTAASVDFARSDYRIQTTLADAQKGYIKASAAAATAEQERTVERLVNCWQFLRYATRTQLAVVEGYEHLQRTYDALDDDDAKLALFAVEDLRATVVRAEREYEGVRESSSVEDTEAVSAISAAEYEGKLAQFDADLGIYRDIDGPLRDYADGVRWLWRAKDHYYGKTRRISTARDEAKKAKDFLVSAEKQLYAIRQSAGADATLTPMLETLGDLAKAKTNAARAIMNG